MARRTDIGRELRKIEAEERAIEAEERSIEEKEDLLRVFEELGLMRWKSYYILTAGAILLLALTFVTALWVMNTQLTDLQESVDMLQTQITTLSGDIKVLEIKIDEMASSGVVVPLDYFMFEAGNVTEVS